MVIGDRKVRGGAPCLIVAEVGLAHDGSLSAAHAYIDAVADAGADAVKFQCHIAFAESTLDEPWRVPPRWPQDATRYAYWQRTSFGPAQWEGLAEHAQSKGLIFLCSPFSVEAVQRMDRLVPAWKVPSGEITNVPLLEAIRGTGKPVILSSGMATWEEILAAQAAVRQPYPTLAKTEVAVLHCTSEYPCRPENVGLSDVLRDFDGLSDHSGTIYAGLAAVAIGCDILEVHVKLSEYDQGFDASSSITIPQLGELVKGVRFIEAAKTPIDKDEMARKLEPMRELFLRKHERRAALA